MIFLIDKKEYKFTPKNDATLSEGLKLDVLFSSLLKKYGTSVDQSTLEKYIKENNLQRHFSEV